MAAGTFYELTVDDVSKLKEYYNNNEKAQYKIGGSQTTDAEFLNAIQNMDIEDFVNDTNTALKTYWQQNGGNTGYMNVYKENYYIIALKSTYSINGIAQKSTSIYVKLAQNPMSEHIDGMLSGESIIYYTGANYDYIRDYSTITNTLKNDQYTFVYEYAMDYTGNNIGGRVLSYNNSRRDYMPNNSSEWITQNENVYIDIPPLMPIMKNQYIWVSGETLIQGEEPKMIRKIWDNGIYNEPYNPTINPIGQIYDKSGDENGTISYEPIIETLTEVPDLSGETITSGEIIDAIGVEFIESPYENFWYDMTMGIAYALTGNNKTLNVNWLGKEVTLNADDFILPYPQELKVLIASVMSVLLVIIMAKWGQETLNQIQSGQIIETVHRCSDDIYIYF